MCYISEKKHVEIKNSLVSLKRPEGRTLYAQSLWFGLNFLKDDGHIIDWVYKYDLSHTQMAYTSSFSRNFAYFARTLLGNDKDSPIAEIIYK